MKKIFLSPMLFSLLVTIVLRSNAQSWTLTGNASTNPTTNFIGTKDNKALAFRTNNIERMRISASGNLGIGTKSPLAKLQVSGGSPVSLSAPGYLTIGNTTDYNMGLDLNTIQARYNGVANSLLLNYYGGAVWMGSHNGNGTLPAFYANTDGRVAIGSSVLSSAALTVNTNAALGGINVTDPGSNYILYSTKSGDGNGIYVSKTKSSSNFDATIYSSNSGNNGAGVMAISTNGDGVDAYSTTSFGMAASSIYYHAFYATTDNYQSCYAGYFNGYVFASDGYLTGSDKNLKQNIKDFTSAMEIINQLHPKQYDYRHDGNYKLMNLPQGEHYGLIAQDVETILPNLVKDSKFETRYGRANPDKENIKNSETISFKALNYTELIPIMIKGMQELQEVNEKQENRIKQLEKTIEKLSGNSTTTSTKLFYESSGAYLKQNAPNPFTQNTIIYCNVPPSAKLAQLMIYDQDGSKIKSFVLNNGINNITISAGSLSSGDYVYSLFIDGKNIDSKKMILTK